MTQKYLSDPAIYQAILECALEPDNEAKIVVTGRAKRDMVEARITKRGVCRAICKWVMAGKIIKEDKAVNGTFKGQPLFVLDSVIIDGKKVYVKLQFMGDVATGSAMKIVSAHRPERA